MADENLMEKIVSLCKRRGFIFPGSEIYGGLAGTWDFGSLGVKLKNNIKQSWRQRFVLLRDDMEELDAAILMNPKVWETSGHTKEFSDPLVSCVACGAAHRWDDPQIKYKGSRKRELGPDEDVLGAEWNCEKCGANNISVETPERERNLSFNLMFETKIGAATSAVVSYLRPETAQGMFANFKNILDANHPKIPFGMAQIGKAFRNEIAPRDFLFRTREFEQMELEYFVRESEWEKYFEEWRKEMLAYFEAVGISKERVHEVEIGERERAHYSKRTIDFEFDFPFGQKELSGLAYRGDFDLKNHMRASGVNLEYFDDAVGERFVPHVIEPSFGLERIILAILVSSYREDEMGGGKREYLAFPASVAPVKCAVFPLLKNKPELVEKAREIYKNIKKEIHDTVWDDNGNVGKRYRRQDEIGTPYCITVDFETLEDGTVTIRDRDSGEQRRTSLEGVILVVLEK